MVWFCALKNLKNKQLPHDYKGQSVFLWFNISVKTEKDWEMFLKEGFCNKLRKVSSLFDSFAAQHTHSSSTTPKVAVVVLVYTAEAH